MSDNPKSQPNIGNDYRIFSEAQLNSISSKLDKILQNTNKILKPPEDDPDCVGGASYYLESRSEASRPKSIISAPPAIRHIFDRITDIVICDREMKDHFDRIKSGNDYFFKSIKDPGGELTAEQLQEINDFWKPYEFCYKNDPDVQRIFSVASGCFDPSYIPWGLFWEFCKQFWNHPIIDFVRNKIYTKIVFPDIKQAKTVIYRIAGGYYNSSRSLITKEEAAKICLEALGSSDGGELILKPWEGGSGFGIAFLNKDASEENNLAVLDEFSNASFVCEEVVKSHSAYSEPHPESLNTLRIITFAYGTDINLVAVLFRMGMGGSKVDNLGSGGLIVLLNEDGELSDYAYDHDGNKVYEHPSGYVFKGKKLPYVDKAIETAKKAHAVIPQLRYISWDYAIDPDGEPVLIELNGGGEQFPLQLSGGHVFINREFTKTVMDNWLLTKFYFNRASWNWNFREYSDHIEITKYAGLYKTVSLPANMNGKPVTAIRNGAFEGKKLQKLTIPSCVKTIEEDALTGVGDSCEIIRL